MGRVSVTVISLVQEYKPAGKEGWMFTLLSSSNSVGKRLKKPVCAHIIKYVLSCCFTDCVCVCVVKLSSRQTSQFIKKLLNPIIKFLKRCLNSERESKDHLPKFPTFPPCSIISYGDGHSPITNVGTLRAVITASSHVSNSHGRASWNLMQFDSLLSQGTPSSHLIPNLNRQPLVLLQDLSLSRKSQSLE